MSGTGHVTTNLKLHVPIFDQSPWDVDVNTNWNILDAAVGQFVAIPNLAGVWTNSHTYTLGQSAIDSFDSSIWYCLQTHTSPPPPTIFSNDRAINPSRWTQTSAGANFYAQQAANSALAAANSAQEAKDAVSGVSGMVPLAGGIMTGPLILNDDPTDPLGSAPKRYVDARVGGTGFLPLSGGTLTGALYAGPGGIGYMSVPAGDRALISFGYNGSVAYVVANGVNLGTFSSREFLAANYLPLAGGTIGGQLTVLQELHVQHTIKLLQNNITINTDNTSTQFFFDGITNSRLVYTLSNNTYEFIRGYDNVMLFRIAGDGNNLMSGTLKVNGALETDGSLFARQGTVFWGVNDQSKLYTDNSTFTNMHFLQNYVFSLNWGSGTMTYYNPSSPSGSLTLGYDGSVGNQKTGVYGNGPYTNTSDERMKTDILPLDRGLRDIALLEPIIFTRVGSEEEEEGFSAQQVQKVFPCAVHITHDDMLGVSLDPIVAALVNGMKELATRMSALENKS